jgi:hypothetical protein
MYMSYSASPVPSPIPTRSLFGSEQFYFQKRAKAPLIIFSPWFVA